MQISSNDKPLTINVFGSAIIRVPADIAVLRFAVSRIAQTPPEAYKLAQDAAKNVREILRRLPPEDVSASRVSLDQTFEHRSNETHFVGYTAKIGFYIVLRELDLTQEILTSVIDQGVNQINSVDLQTSRLKEIRATARRNAVLAAREKAENYCLAAGVRLGEVIHIADVNPETLRTEGHYVRSTPPDGEEVSRAIDPESITINAAVIMDFELIR